MSRGTARAYPGPGIAVLMTLALLGLQVALGIVVGVVWGLVRHGGMAGAGDAAIPPIVFGIINTVVFAVVIAWAAVANRGTFRSLWHGRRCGGAVWSAALLAVVGLVVVLGCIGNLLTRMVPVPKELLDVFAGLTDLKANPVSVVFTLVVVAAVGEEWLFRGYILRGLLDHLRPRAAVALSAVLFAVMHANFWQLPVGLGLGLLCGFVYLRTRSLVLCIGMHAANNSLALSLPYLPFTIAGVNDGSEGGPLPPWWFAALGCALLGAGWALLARTTRSLVRPPVLPAGEGSASVPSGEACAAAEALVD